MSNQISTTDETRATRGQRSVVKNMDPPRTKISMVRGEWAPAWLHASLGRGRWRERIYNRRTFDIL